MVPYAADVLSRLVSNFHTDPTPPARKRAAEGVAAARSEAEPDAMPKTIISRIVETDIPARLDALPFGRFDLLVIAALGITWILDGLEVTLAGALSGALKKSAACILPTSKSVLPGACYLSGAVLGALFFGWLTDRLGRKKLFFITLGSLPSRHRGDRAVVERFQLLLCSAFSPAPASAANTPPSIRQSRSLSRRGYRGFTDLLINGSFWVGSGFWRGRFPRPARSRRHRSGNRLAACFSDRGDYRTCDSR